MFDLGEEERERERERKKERERGWGGEKGGRRDKERRERKSVWNVLMALFT